MKLIKEGLEKGEIRLPENIEKFDTLKKGAYKKDWNVYIKKPFRGVNSVLKYLARYTHRVAISNSRLVEFTGEHVTFRYTDNKDKGKRKIMKLKTNEFIRRYLQHILPANFYKIRYIVSARKLPFFQVFDKKASKTRLSKCWKPGSLLL